MTSVILLRSYACWFLTTIIPFAYAQNGGDVITIPPAITQQPNQHDSHFFTQRTSITVMPCVATGSPGVSFQWLRNGVVVPPKPIPADRPSSGGAFYNSDPANVGGTYNGTMVVYGTGDALLGAYQCFPYLTVAPQIKAMSDIAYVHEQYFTPFPAPNLVLTTKSVAAGEYVQLVCAALVMSPMPLVTWELKDNPKATLIDNKRIVLDDKGTLHILSALSTGLEFSGQLQCIQHNAEVNAYARGQPTTLTLDTSVNMGYRAPKVAYVSDSPKYILAGAWDGTDEQEVAHTAYCIFSANPAPTVQWSRADGSPISTDVEANGPLLFFRNAVVADSGTYICTAVNYNGNVASSPVTQQIRVEVRSKPSLNQNVSTLVNRTVGETVVIDCAASGSPAPSYKWYVNSVPERDYTTDISNRVTEGNRLTIYRLGKPEDMSLITCNASNAVGSVMRTVGIKVYNKTSIVSYTPVVYANFTDTVVMACTADADASLPIDVYWTRKGSSTRIVTAPERHVFVFSG